MKMLTKRCSLLLACLMMLLCFASCQGNKETEKESATKPTETEEETGRNAIKDGVPANLNYGGKETVTFLYRNTGGVWIYELACEELMNDALYDSIHYRNIDVENRLGVKIQTVGQTANWGAEVAAWNKTLSTSVLTNTHDFDGAAIYASQSSALVKEGIYYDFNKISTDYGDGYIDLSKPWWNQTLVDELTTYGALFFLAGDLLVSETAQGFCLFFNKDLFNEKFPSVGTNALYQTVRDQKWTIETLTDYVSGVWDDTNSNGIIDDGDVMGWNGLGGVSDGGMDSWIYALGLNITKPNAYGEPEISIIYDPDTVPAYELVKKLYMETKGSYGSSDLTTVCTETLMKNGNLLFDRVTLNEGAGMRDSAVNYGVLPMPKLNEEQEEYRTIFCNNASLLVLCSNLTDEKAKIVSALIELMSASSYKTVTPVYYSTVLQGIYSKDQADAEMYDMILKSFVADFGFAYSTMSLNEVGSIFRDVSKTCDIRTKIESKKQSYETALEQLLKALDEVSG